MKNATYIKEFTCRLQRGTKVGKGGDRNMNASVKSKMCIRLNVKYGICPYFFISPKELEASRICKNKPIWKR